MFILVILCIATYLGVNAHNNWVVKPEQLADRLLASANGQQALAAGDYDAKSIRANAELIVQAQLRSDLALTNLPEDLDASALLKTQATAFLADDQLLQRWLMQWLKTHFSDTDNPWQTIRLTRQQRQLRSGEFCMTIAAVQHHWQLQSVGPCQAAVPSDGS